MQVIIPFFLLAFAALATADCSVANFAKDPTPWGGANCTNDKDCGGGTVLGAGVCDFTGGAGNCVCPKGRAMPNCSYVRGNKDLPGGLNIGLCVDRNRWSWKHYRRSHWFRSRTTCPHFVNLSPLFCGMFRILLLW